MTALAIEETPIPGLLLLRLPMHEDARGWFKESWHREKMTALGLPDFAPVQSNVALSRLGATRGVHAEPWDKYVSVSRGRVFAAWVDLREGPTFGATFHCEQGPATAVFVPRGVGNAYQVLEDDSAYAYLVNEHWRAGTTYPALSLTDPDAAIPWPIPLDAAEVSAKDLLNPTLDRVTPIPPRRTLVIGGRGQLGQALTAAIPTARAVDLDELDVTDAEQLAAWAWQDYDVVVNAAAYTAVDAAETTTGRQHAWALNASAPVALAALACRHRFALVHYSTDYVFDGTHSPHDEEEPVTPLGVYGQSKAAGDLAVRCVQRHYLIRTGWLCGDGHNFVRTITRMAEAGDRPQVVDDQIGRLTFADELARATRHLLDTRAAYGTYNCTNAGPAMSWFEVARRVFEYCGRSPADVTPVSTTHYTEGKSTAHRPTNSVLDLAKLEATGFVPEDARAALQRYLGSHATGASR
jgi:dTDP-4-dehydrorhamnose 3,5-epimerase